MSDLISRQPTDRNGQERTGTDLISRQAAIDALMKRDKELRNINWYDKPWAEGECKGIDYALGIVNALPSAQPIVKEAIHITAQSDSNKYEYHYDHTDCIWYRPEARNRCPVTCAQYRDGWNDAMNYIFRDGKGYRPYRRGEKYE